MKSLLFGPLSLPEFPLRHGHPSLWDKKFGWNAGRFGVWKALSARLLTNNGSI
jgi:hypothetical protein